MAIKDKKPTYPAQFWNFLLLPPPISFPNYGFLPKPRRLAARDFTGLLQTLSTAPGHIEFRAVMKKVIIFDVASEPISVDVFFGNKNCNSDTVGITAT